MVHAHGKRPTSSYLLCFLFRDALGLPHGAHLDFPRSREWEVAVGRYRALLVAFEIQAHDILLRLTNRRLYIGIHVKPYLAGLNGEWEERLTLWTLAVQTAPEKGVDLPLFPVEAAHPPKRTRAVAESGPIIRGQIDQERAAPGAAENKTTEVEIPRRRDTPELPVQGPRPRQQHPGQQCQRRTMKGGGVGRTA